MTDFVNIATAKACICSEGLHFSSNPCIVKIACPKEVLTGDVFCTVPNSFWRITLKDRYTYKTIEILEGCCSCPFTLKLAVTGNYILYFQGIPHCTITLDEPSSNVIIETF